jgi:hypothetical protein
MKPLILCCNEVNELCIQLMSQQSTDNLITFLSLLLSKLYRSFKNEIGILCRMIS